MELRQLSTYFTGIDARQNVVRALLAVLVFIFAVWAGLTVQARFTAVKKLSVVKKAELERFAGVAQTYLRKKGAVDAISKRAYAANGDKSTIAVLEDIARSAGAGERIVSVKPLGESERLGYTEKTFDLKLDSVDLNTLVNLVYAIENHRTLLQVREFSMKSRFEDPNLLDISIKITHLAKLP